MLRHERQRISSIVVLSFFWVLLKTWKIAAIAVVTLASVFFFIDRIAVTMPYAALIYLLGGLYLFTSGSFCLAGQ